MEKRMFKNGKEAKSEIKAINVITIEDIQVGKLSIRGKNEDNKMFSEIKVKDSVPAGTKVCLRCSIVGPKDIKVYIHGYGWASFNTKLSDKFDVISKRANFDNLIEKNYYSMDNLSKVQAFITVLPELIENVQLTISEKLVVMNLQGIELSEGIKQLGCDKSLQYKVKKNMDQHIEKILNKFENRFGKIDDSIKINVN